MNSLSLSARMKVLSSSTGRDRSRRLDEKRETERKKAKRCLAKVKTIRNIVLDMEVRMLTRRRYPTDTAVRRRLGHR